MQVDPLLAIPAGWPHQQAVELQLARHVFLGQRRALIGQDRLLADQRERAGIAERPQLGRQGGARLSRADDDDRVRHARA